MPTLDRKQQFDRMELSATVTFTKSLSGGQVSGGAVLRTRWAPDYLNLVTGIELRVDAGEGIGPAPNGTYVYLTIPLLGVSNLLVATLSASVIVTTAIALLIQIDVPRLYSMPGAWRLKMSALRVYVNGSLVHTEGSTTLDNYYYFAPAGVPLLGIPPYLGPSGAVNPVPVIGAVARSSTVGSTTSSFKTRISDAGWRFREESTGEWQDLPVLVDLLDPPGTECDCESPSPATLVATRTTGIVVESEQVITTTCTLEASGLPVYCTNGPATGGGYDLYKTVLTWEGRTANVLALPNMPASVKRLGSTGHRELVYRGGMPGTRRSAVSTCGIDGIGSGVSTNPVAEDVHPRQTSILGSVGNSAHALEDTFGYDVCAPAASGGFRYESTGYLAVVSGAIACPAPAPDDPPGSVIAPSVPADEICFVSEGAEFGALVDTETDNPYLLGYLYHVDPLVRYVNYWASRHWSFLDWFPINTIDSDEDGYPDVQDQWEVFLDRIAVEYWLAKGDQMCRQASLPTEEGTDRRTTLLTAPLLRGAQSGFMTVSVFGCATNWWGSETFRVDNTVPLASVTLDAASSGEWSFEDCSGAFGGSGITLTPDAGHTTIVARRSLGSFTVHPYLYFHLVQELEIDWDDPNIVSVLVELVGESGTTVTLTTEKGRFARPKGADNKYAGSHVLDHGQLFFVDTGEDLIPADGVSATYMVDPELVHAFSLLAGRTASELRYTIVVASDAATCLIAYPVLWASEDAPGCFPENRSDQAVVWPDGPGIRFGNVAHWYGTPASLHAVPMVYNPGVPPFNWKASPLDWICFKNLALLAEPYNDNLAAELTALFDSDEIPLGAEDADGYSIASLIPASGRTFPRAAIVNGAECPPVCMFPRRSRGADLEPDGDWEQETCSYAEERRFMVGSSAMHLYRPGTAEVWTAPISPAVSGWPVTYHRHAVDNNEDYFDIKQGARAIATIRPWQGCMIVRRADSDGEIGREPDVLHIADTFSWDALVVYDEGLARDSLIVRRAHGQPTLGYETRVEVADGDHASYPSLAYVPWGRLWCGYTWDGSFRAKPSDDDGETWGTEVSLIPNSYFGVLKANDDGELLAIAFRYDSGTSGPGKLFYRYQGPGDSAFSAATAIKDSAGADIAFEPETFDLSPDSSIGGWSLFAKKSGDTGPSRFFCTDEGATWTEVT